MNGEELKLLPNGQLLLALCGWVKRSPTAWGRVSNGEPYRLGGGAGGKRTVDARREATRHASAEYAEAVSWVVCTPALQELTARPNFTEPWSLSSARDLGRALVIYPESPFILAKPLEEFLALSRLADHPMFVLMRPAAFLRAERPSTKFEAALAHRVKELTP